MTEQDLIDLGFEREDENSFHYYTLDLVRGIELISNNSDDLVDEKWYVEFFDADGIKFIDKENLEAFINIVKINSPSVRGIDDRI